MELRENASRLKLAMRLMIAVIIADLIGVVVSIVSIKLLNDIELGDYDQNILDLFDQISMVYGVLYAILFIVTVIFFIMWFRRAYFNVHQFAITPPRFSEGWAAGGWFVPILSLFRPVQIMRIIWQETIAYLSERSPIIPKANIQGTISLWWGLWVVANILSNISFRLPSETIEMMKIGYYFDLASGILFIPCGMLLIVIMRSYGELEEEVQLVQNKEIDSDSIFY